MAQLYANVARRDLELVFQIFEMNGNRAIN